MTAGGSNGTNRVRELRRVTDPMERDEFLADQITEVETNLTELSGAVRALTAELSTTRIEMSGNANKILWAVLTGCISLLVGIILALSVA
jgi:hypothetical protein